MMDFFVARQKNHSVTRPSYYSFVAKDEELFETPSVTAKCLLKFPNSYRFEFSLFYTFYKLRSTAISTEKDCCLSISKTLWRSDACLSSGIEK